MESFLQAIQGEKRDPETDQPDYRRPLDDAEAPLCDLEEEGDGDDHAADEIRNRGCHGRPEIRTELFRCNGDEYGPVPDGKTDRKAMGIEARGAHMPHHEIGGNGNPGEDLEEKDDLFPRSEILTEEPAEEIPQNQSHIAEHHRLSCAHRAAHVECPAEFRGEGDEDTHRKPDGKADENGVHVSEEALANGKEAEKIASAHVHPFHLAVHARFEDADPHHEQQYAEPAADEVCHTPVEVLCDGVCQDGARNTHGGYDHGAVAARVLGKIFEHQGDPCAQLSGQSHAGDKPPESIAADGMDEAVCDIGYRIEEYGAEEDLHASPLVAQYPPKDASNQHPAHLHVQQEDTLIQECLPLQADGLEAGDADDAEEYEVIDVDEVAKRGDDHRKGKDMFKGKVRSNGTRSLLLFHGAAIL